MATWYQRLQRREARTNAVGAALVIAGLLLLLVSQLVTRSAADGGTLERSLSLALQVAQHMVTWGQGLVDESQIRFNGVVVTVLLDELGADHGTAAGFMNGLGSVVFDLLSPLSLLTVGSLLVARALISRALDQRYPHLADRDLSKRVNS